MKNQKIRMKNQNFVAELKKERKSKLARYYYFFNYGWENLMDEKNLK
jgi:hypothetical protein